MPARKQRKEDIEALHEREGSSSQSPDVAAREGTPTPAPSDAYGAPKTKPGSGDQGKDDQEAYEAYHEAGNPQDPNSHRDRRRE